MNIAAENVSVASTALSPVVSVRTITGLLVAMAWIGFGWMIGNGG